MKVTSYIHPIRTYLPCTGVGRHINNVLLGIEKQAGVDLNLFFSRQWLARDGLLDQRCPLRHLPYYTFPTPENITERLWKTIGMPKMDCYIPSNTDWIYAPVDTFLPVSCCPVAITVHDIAAFEENLPWSNTLQHRLFRMKWKQWIGKAIKNCRVLFTISEFSKRRLIELADADPSKIYISGNGVDEAFFQISKVDPRSLDSPVKGPYALVIGGLRYKKGAEHILKVADKLRKQNADIHIVVVGESEVSYIQASKEFPNITVLGMVSDDALPNLLRAASSLLFLSLYEGFGIPALEAMASGVPAVVSNKGSLPEIVGKAGIVVEPANTDQIAEVLTELQTSTKLREDYVNQGYDHVKQYTWSSCAARVLDVLRENT